MPPTPMASSRSNVSIRSPGSGMGSAAILRRNDEEPASAPPVRTVGGSSPEGGSAGAGRKEPEPSGRSAGCGNSGCIGRLSGPGRVTPVAQSLAARDAAVDANQKDVNALGIDTTPL